MQLNELVISSSRTLKRRLHGRTTAKVKSFVIALQKLLCIDCYIVKLRELPVQMKMGNAISVVAYGAVFERQTQGDRACHTLV
jgi:hypothetical protein